MTKQSNSNPSCSDTDPATPSNVQKPSPLTEYFSEVPEDLLEEWEGYVSACESLGAEPDVKRFVKYNRTYPLHRQ